MVATIMFVAIETVHRPKGYWNSGGGYEMNTMYIALALLLANHGYGMFSFDQLTGLGRRMRPIYGWLGMAGAIGAALMMLAQRETQPHVTRGEAPAEEQTTSPA